MVARPRECKKTALYLFLACRVVSVRKQRSIFFLLAAFELELIAHPPTLTLWWLCPSAKVAVPQARWQRPRSKSRPPTRATTRVMEVVASQISCVIKLGNKQQRSRGTATGLTSGAHGKHYPMDSNLFQEWE